MTFAPPFLLSLSIVQCDLIINKTKGTLVKERGLEICLLLGAEFPLGFVVQDPHAYFRAKEFILDQTFQS